LKDLWYAPNYLLTERRERALVQSLWGQGFFSADAKVGILIEDTPDIRAGVENGMIPALAAHGITPVAKVVYSDPLEANWPNYVLQLQSAGVTHVLMSATEGSGFGTASAMKAADSQQYKPRWAIATDQAPAALIGLGAPASQLANTFGMGWAPVADVADVSAQSPNTKLCEDLNRAAGQPPTTYSYCEDLLFLKFVLDRATELSPKGMTDALARVGTDWQDITNIGGASLLAPARHDGVSTARAFAFDDRCGQQGASCFKYTSDPSPIP
jgi:hypothetical protein